MHLDFIVWQQRKQARSIWRKWRYVPIKSRNRAISVAARQQRLKHAYIKWRWKNSKLKCTFHLRPLHLPLLPPPPPPVRHAPLGSNWQRLCQRLGWTVEIWQTFYWISLEDVFLFSLVCHCYNPEAAQPWKGYYKKHRLNERERDGEEVTRLCLMKSLQRISLNKKQQRSGRQQLLQDKHTP